MCVRKCVRKRFWKCACVVGACGLICELRCAIALFTLPGWYGGRWTPYYGIFPWLIWGQANTVLRNFTLVDMGADEYRTTEYVNKYKFINSPLGFFFPWIFKDYSVALIHAYNFGKQVLFSEASEFISSSEKQSILWHEVLCLSSSYIKQSDVECLLNGKTKIFLFF